jgi:hypothetical protein
MKNLKKLNRYPAKIVKFLTRHSKKYIFAVIHAGG